MDTKGIATDLSLWRDTPWGPATHVEHVEAGLVVVSTASHGGYWVSIDRAEVIARKHPQVATSPLTRWFEEEYRWAFVASTFPDDFSPEDAPVAAGLLAHYYGERRELRRKLFGGAS